MTQKQPFRCKIEQFIQQNAHPVDKFTHQPRLYQLACQLATQSNLSFDDDILHAAAWLHDIGVFVGHRPEDPEQLATWDNIAYALRLVPTLLTQWDFPTAKVPSVLNAIATHQPQQQPQTPEAILLHDADLLELLGATGLCRALAKTGRDTRYTTYESVIPVLEQTLKLPQYLLLESARIMAQDRLLLTQQFLTAAQNEWCGSGETQSKS